MNRERYEALIHLYVDHKLDKKEAQALEAYMETSTECREAYEEIKALKDLLGGMQMKELPEGFEKELHVKLVEASVEKESSWKGKIREILRRGLKMKMAVSFGGVAIAALLLIGNSGLLPNMNQLKSAQYESSYEITEEASEDYNMAASEVMMDTMAVEEFAVPEEPAMKSMPTQRSDDVVLGGEGHSAPSKSDGTGVQEGFKGRLIIKTANLTMEVEDYDATSTELYRMVEEMGGYISDASSYYYIYDRYDTSNNKKSGYMTLRIPHQFFDQFIGQMNGFGDVVNFSSNANDITKDYRDITAEVKNLEVRESKLREIIDKAEKIEDIIEVEAELSRVRSEINSYQSVLKDWEDLVTLSTITLNMTEVEDLKIVQPVDKNMLTKAKEGFIYTINRIVDWIEGLFIWLIASSPVLVPVVIVSGVIMRKIYKRWKK